MGCLIFGHAQAFYRIKTSRELHCIVVYTPLCNLNTALNVQRGDWASGTLQIADTREIRALIGIWEGFNTKKIYILRKHPGLEMLSEEESGIEAEYGVENEQEIEELRDGVNI